MALRVLRSSVPDCTAASKNWTPVLQSPALHCLSPSKASSIQEQSIYNRIVRLEIGSHCQNHSSSFNHCHHSILWKKRRVFEFRLNSTTCWILETESLNTSGKFGKTKYSVHLNKTLNFSSKKFFCKQVIVYIGAIKPNHLSIHFICQFNIIYSFRVF